VHNVTSVESFGLPVAPHRPYPTIEEFAASDLMSDDAWSRPPWACGPDPMAILDPTRVRPQLEDLLDTLVAVQRAEWLQDGVYAGPRSLPDAYRDLLECCRVLKIPMPPTIVAGAAARSQATLGTDARPFLLLSSFFLQGATEPERRFLIGRLCGHIRARQVTWGTTYALLVDQGGFRQLAARALGPALDVVLGPVSMVARLALSRAHRAAELTADRAGLLCASRDPAVAKEAAMRAFLRMTLGVNADVDPAAWVAQLRSAHADGSPSRFVELLSSTPGMHARWAALDAFSRSALYRPEVAAAPNGCDAAGLAEATEAAMATP
jgi:hypothetical protein